MLKQLLVENYALIDKLEIQFDNGLTIITGETGAGKSILLGAMALILGQRADTQVLLDKEKKCLVEGTFNITALDLDAFFDEHQLDYDPFTCIRREINPQGKSRAFINDTPVNLNVLKEFGEKLIDIHSQHHNLLLSESGFQFAVLDGFASTQKQLASFKALFNHWNEQKKKLDALRQQDAQLKTEQDYLQYQFDELNQVKLDAEEFGAFETELEILSHAESIQLALQKSSFLLAQNEPSILTQLKEVLSEISAIAKINPALLALKQRLEETSLELKDINGEIVHLESGIHSDAERQDFLISYFDTTNRLMLKHHVKDVQQLIEIKQDLEHKINKISSIEEHLEQLSKELEATDRLLREAGQELSRLRLEKLPELEKKVSAMLSELGMPNGRFKVQLHPEQLPGPFGFEKIDFFFNANLGGTLGELGKIASGGELSRVMLCIKSLLVEKNMLPTIIFDEIDTGISGEVAAKAGSMLETLAQNKQVISITHLPQIASRGKNHFLVYKKEEGQSTLTRMRKLTEEERVQHIAKLISGESTSSAALEAARILLQTEKTGKN